MMYGTLKWPLMLSHWVWHDGTILQMKNWVWDVKRWTWLQILTSHTMKSLYWAQANVTPESASLPCSASALIKAVCSWIVCIEILLMYLYTVACACVYTCLWKLGVHIRCLLHCFPSCFLADAVDWVTSKPQGSSFCASPTQTTAVQSYQLLGSGCLNSDPHVCTSYTL